MNKIVLSLVAIFCFDSSIFACQDNWIENSENQNESSYKQEYLSEEPSPDPSDFSDNSDNSYSEEDWEVWHGYAGNYPSSESSSSSSDSE